MLRFFRYSGNKLKYVKQINNLIKNSKSKIYIEPFIGSGAIFFNLQKSFDKYIINDKDRNIIRIYLSFKEINYNDYLNELKFIEKEFGDIKNCKECYYNFRNWFNEKYWNTNTIKEGIYLHFLTNTCINSFLRFGPNGMNQSYGNRFYKLNYYQFNNIKQKLQNVEIYNEDYKKFFEIKNSLLFLDPPYFLRPSSYDDFDKNEIDKFIQLINESQNEIIYTDILNYKNKYLNYIILRKMQNTSPNRKNEFNGYIEVIFYKNLKYDKNNLF